MKRSLLAFILCILAGLAQAKGVPFAVKSLPEAESIARQDGSRHVLVFFTSEYWSTCRRITAELSGGELKDLYSKDFVVFEADSPDRYAAGTRMRQLTTRGYTPVFVFLDASGKKVLETAGFRNAREARALHEFVAKRLYLKTTWQDFAARATGK